MLAALDENAVWEILAEEQSAFFNMLATRNLKGYQLDDSYTQLLENLEIKASRHVDFLALVHNFLLRNNLEEKATGTDSGPSTGMLVHRFIHVWGGAVWGDSNFTDGEPPVAWTRQCQRTTERLLGTTMCLLFIHMQLDFPRYEKTIILQREDDPITTLRNLHSSMESIIIPNQTYRTPENLLSISQMASRFASRAAEQASDKTTTHNAGTSTIFTSDTPLHIPVNTTGIRTMSASTTTANKEVA
ncbi:hypothetical protein GJ744_009870 [Endocarpon pusillum]|uniref:Uncharacterized protein n=1 Tax=Endocarpon pusillum TaxID=364733 RepID=A0A8H7E4L9_9EURO|nr:hypothetical protein GJ744_009870 [Endocarpon pusillum]